jgi:dipeptidyl aminopeptidase/acylaminoacyl peptidase
VVYDVAERGSGGDLWIRDLARSLSSRFTFDAEREFAPVWSPDGKTIVFSKETAAGWDLYVKDAAGTGEAKPVIASPVQKFATDWSRDGRYLIFNSSAADTGWDLYALSMTGGSTNPIPLLKTRFTDMAGTVSPDGRFLAYQSNESGRNQVYVQEFPTPRSKWQVSSEGGVEPFWRRDGRELYFRAPDLSIMAVPVQVNGATFQTGLPQALFRARFGPATARARFRPAPDGQRFLVLTRADDVAVQPAIVVLNWTEGLK